MRHPNPNVLLRIAQADAYALPAEYIDRSEHKELYEQLLAFEGYKQHPTYHKVKAGTYTDDSQMSCAVAEVLISAQSDPMSIKPEEFFDAFYLAFKRDPRDGYSRGFQKLLEEVKSPGELRLTIKNDSNRNGAAMRSVPIGFIRNPKHIVQVAGMQAATTHGTWGGIASSIAVALMSHFAHRRNESFASMSRWCSQYHPVFEHFRVPWMGPVHHAKNDPKELGVGVTTAWAVCTLLEKEKSLMGIMKGALEFGGDTDSVASIAWGIASARYPDEVIPEFMERDLEQGSNYGVGFLKELGLRLTEAYK